MKGTLFSRRAFLRRACILGVGAAFLAGCKPQIVEVTTVVEKVVKETVEVQKRSKRSSRRPWW